MNLLPSSVKPTSVSVWILQITPAIRTANSLRCLFFGLFPCCCVVLVLLFDWKKRLLICNRNFYVSTFEIYCKFIHLLTTLSSNCFFSITSVISSKTRSNDAFTSTGGTCARVGNICGAKLNSAELHNHWKFWIFRWKWSQLVLKIELFF